jgi:hypothetical protein
VSPRFISSDGILKEQPIPKDNYTTKTEIVMPPKKRRRYTPRQKKKLQEPPEEPPIPKYQQMIQLFIGNGDPPFTGVPKRGCRNIGGTFESGL